jgi:nicotinamide riboside transporter PnuC
MPPQRPQWFTEASFTVLRLDYLSCVLTIASTVLVGRRCWEGWALATVNSVIICIIAVRTAQFGFVPANLFCIAMSAMNLHSWRKRERDCDPI